MPQALPIDSTLPDLLERFEGGERCVVLEAPAGAGKTTRVPPALAGSKCCPGRVVIGEPRRLAARLAAHRVAQEAGQAVGHWCGYRVRFDEKCRSDTAVLFETQGLVLRRLLSSRGLDGVGGLVFDEVHERSTELDASLALLPQAMERHPHLKVVVMSATLDTDQLDAHFEGAAKLTCHGRSFEVQIEHQRRPDDRPLEVQVRSAVKEASQREGDVLVFLPGAREINRAKRAILDRTDREVLTLHGDLSLGEQSQVVNTPQNAPPRIILSTNIAETSVTIPRITTVVDSGLARVAKHDPLSGVQRLITQPISQARCVQRAGRAGRVAPGRCVRLFTRGDFEARPRHDMPEILRSDLGSLLLMLRAHQVEPRSLPWLSAPSNQAWQEAENHLRALGALDAEGVTDIGRKMVQFGLPPRLARVLVEAEICGLQKTAARAVALLAERDIVLRSRALRGKSGEVQLSDSDLEDRLEKLEHAAEERFDKHLLRDLDLDPGAVRRVWQLSKQLRTIAERSSSAPKDSRNVTATARPGAAHGQSLLSCLFTGFFDRVALRRGDSRKLVLSTGLSATLSEESGVQNARCLLVLAAVQGRAGETVVHWAARLDPDWLFELRPDLIEAKDGFVYNEKSDRIEQVSKLSYGKLVLDESRTIATASGRAKELLCSTAFAKGPAVFDPQGRLESLAVRIALLNEHVPELMSNVGADSQHKLEQWAEDPEALQRSALDMACAVAGSMQELAQQDLQALVLTVMPAPICRALDEELPLHLVLPAGRRLVVHYEANKTPWVASRLQDFFSVTRTPRLCSGRLPVQVHLLAPNRRAVQVTQDLEGFWERHYPELRKQLMRRYPKHSWPEDGRTAKPPAPGKLR